MHTKQDYKKLLTAIRYYLHGKEYFVALRAMEFASQYHAGTRKDGVAPEFQHQVSQANFCRTLEKSLVAPHLTLTTIFLHDVVEDYDVTIQQITSLFGSKVAREVQLLTNKHADGTKKPKDVYYAEIASSPIASIVKGCDRMHNLQSMHTADFSQQKQLDYIEETEKYVLPMLKAARRGYPDQEAAYENIKHGLMLQVELIQLIHQ